MYDKFWTFVGRFILIPLYIIFAWIIDLYDRFQLTIIVAALLTILFLGAAGLSQLTKNDREACIKAGYEWSAVKYVCVVNLKK